MSHAKLEDFLIASNIILVASVQKSNRKHVLNEVHDLKSSSAFLDPSRAQITSRRGAKAWSTSGGKRTESPELAVPLTRLAVSVACDVDGSLVPPVEHQHHQNVPQLVTGTKVVQLP